MTVQPFVASILVMLLCACTDTVNVASHNESATKLAAARTVVVESQARAGGAIAVKSRLLGEVVLHQPVTVELSIAPGSFRSLWLTIVDSEHFELQGDYERHLTNNGQWTITEQITLTPLSAGKHYLRMTLAHEDGSNPRSVVVALKVPGEAGESPAANQPPKARIEFQSRPVQ